MDEAEHKRISKRKFFTLKTDNYYDSSHSYLESVSYQVPERIISLQWLSFNITENKLLSWFNPAARN